MFFDHPVTQVINCRVVHFFFFFCGKSVNQNPCGTKHIAKPSVVAPILTHSADTPFYSFLRVASLFLSPGFFFFSLFFDSFFVDDFRQWDFILSAITVRRAGSHQVAQNRISPRSHGVKLRRYAHSESGVDVFFFSRSLYFFYLKDPLFTFVVFTGTSTLRRVFRVFVCIISFS